MTYTIPLSPRCLEWVVNLPEYTQALLGWTLSNRGVPRKAGSTNYDITPEELENALVVNFGHDYNHYALTHDVPDKYQFIPANPPWVDRLSTIFYKVLPYLFFFLFGLACGMDF